MGHQLIVSLLLKQNAGTVFKYADTQIECLKRVEDELKKEPSDTLIK